MKRIKKILKQLIALLLIPVSLFMIILEYIIDFAKILGEEFFLLIGEGIKTLIQNNYDFWKEKFKWKN